MDYVIHGLIKSPSKHNLVICIRTKNNLSNTIIINSTYIDC
jgi:hypothetical protein